MGTYEDNGRTASYLPAEEQERGTFTADRFSEDDLVERMDNVCLKFDENQVAEFNGTEAVSGMLFIGLLPLRPYAGDCPHYVRTGTCKFGQTCKYNHPVKKAQQVFRGKDLDSDNFGTIECKYFSTAGGCKYGKSCRYSHPGEESENTDPQLNLLGFPMRLGEKECPHYMRKGSCAYGTRCFYHHPDPITMAGKGFLSENCYVGPLHLSGSSKPYQAPWSLPKLSGNVDPYSGNYPSPPWNGKPSAWNGYRDSSSSNKSRNSHSSPTANGSVRETDEFPERPGLPECDYFMKTGNCKFRSTCRFHHPKNRIPKPDECVLNENGLPLRPGRSVCRHYDRHGLCKFGSACLFDHPANRG